MKKKSKAVRYNKWGYIFLLPFIIVYVFYSADLPVTAFGRMVLGCEPEIKRTAVL